MRWPEFLDFTPEERRAMLAVLLFTGGGGVLIELGRRYPAWTPDFRLTASLDRSRAGDSTAAGDTAAGGDSSPPGIEPDSAAGSSEHVDPAFVTAGLGRPESAHEAGGKRPVADEPTGPVDLNTASAGELTRLPGVGPKLAERIVADRAAHGAYRSVAELDRVKGVGPALLQKIAGMAVVSVASGAARRPG
ncbi:MAG TPA: helix-hairpin-helix domain-containing protein [Candidatus Eisenbacteria bacterium]